MVDIIKKHFDIFGVMPIVIGMFWDDIEKETQNIENSIKDNKPYNEYDLLSDEEKKAFDKGELLF